VSLRNKPYALYFVFFKYLLSLYSPFGACGLNTACKRYRYINQCFLCNSDAHKKQNDYTT
jgi:hypothetical protein